MEITDKLLKDLDHDSIYLKGEGLCHLGHYVDAIGVLDKVIAAEPGHAHALEFKGVALYQLGSFNEALQFFDQALGIDPDLPDALVFKGLIYSKYGKHAEALALYDRALIINPGFIQAWYAQCLTLAIQQKYAESILAYEKILHLDPKLVDALIGISVSTEKQENNCQEKIPPLSPARKNFHNLFDHGALPSPTVPPVQLPGSAVTNTLPPRSKTVIKSRDAMPGFAGVRDTLKRTGLITADPDNSLPIKPAQDKHAVLTVYAQKHPGKDLPESASVPLPASPRCSLYNEMIQDMENNADTVTDTDHWRTLGDLYMKTGRYRDAVKTFERILAIEHDDADAWRSLGNARKKSGIYDEALSAYDRSLEIDPGNHSAWVYRAKVLVMVRRHEDAIASCDQAIALDEASIEAWLYKWFILKKIRRNTDAIRVYDRILALKSGHPRTGRAAAGNP
jgi:superkiller protein 3